MKTLLYTICTLFISLSLSAQCITEANEKYSIDGDIVKVERFDNNGNLVETGEYLKDGSLNGKWTSYRVDGSTKSIAYYEAGEKTGNWTHYDAFKNMVHQVSYEDGVIADVASVGINTLVKD